MSAMKTSGTNRKIRVLLTEIRRGKLVPRPEFQRRLVWSNKDKSSFIETVLLGYPFPEIYIAAGDVDTTTGEGQEMLVDGQQRLTTLNQYFLGSKDLKLLPGITPYENLSEPDKLDFLDYDVVVRDLGKKSIEEIKSVFQRINSTKYSLNAMEIHNARFDGEFKKFAETLSQHDFFDKHRVFSTNEIRRMSDIKFVLIFIVTIMSNYFNRDNSLEEYLEKYNDEFESKSEISKEINGVLSFIDKCDFNLKSRVWKKADLLTLLVETHRIIYKNKDTIPANTASRKLKKFYDKIDKIDVEKEKDKSVLNYYKAAIQASNDRSSRVNRGEIIFNLLNPASLKSSAG